MLAILLSLGMFIVDLFKSRRRVEAENLFLRHQLSIALRRCPYRKPKTADRERERLILTADERSLQIDLVRLDRNIPAAA